MPISQGKLRVIAVEEHISTDAYIDAAARLEVGSGEERERSFMDVFNANSASRRRVVDIDARLAEMDASGTDVSVLSLNPPGVQFFRDGDRATALASEMNDWLTDLIVKHPTRFGGLAAIAPQQPDQAARELKRAMGRLGIGGVMINSHTLGHYLDEPQFEPILAAAEEEGATIYLHPAYPAPQCWSRIVDMVCSPRFGAFRPKLARTPSG